MNKFVIAAALVATMACLVSAKFEHDDFEFGHRGGLREENELLDSHKELEFQGKEFNNFKRRGHRESGFKNHHGSHGHRGGECDCDEFEHHPRHRPIHHRQRPHHEHGGHEHGGHKHGGHKHGGGFEHGGHKHGGGFEHGGGHKHGGHKSHLPIGHLPPIHARHGSGAIFEEREGNRGSLNLQDDDRERIHAEGNKFENKSGAKGIIGAHVHKDHKGDTGVHQHQRFNKDKVIIKDKVSGSNDVDINQRVRDNKDADVFAAGSIGSETEFANNRFDADREQDRNLNTHNSNFRDREGAEFSEF